jgi:hypothetical protein
MSTVSMSHADVLQAQNDYHNRYGSGHPVRQQPTPRTVPVQPVQPVVVLPIVVPPKPVQPPAWPTFPPKL